MRTLNLGILAHVDAGKTTLTERLLYAAGIIDAPGSVDAGTTQTDSLTVERQRGITIKSAVVSFAIDDVAVNLIDTPGHPEFIAEVERVLRVLDGAVLVVSAVEGVQPQTRILMRALKRLAVPSLVFVNKIDRLGARDESVLRGITEQLDVVVVPMGFTSGLGSRAADFVLWETDDTEHRFRLAEVLADRDETVLAGLVDNEDIAPRRLQAQLRAQTQGGFVHPVFFGSAITGAGLAALMGGIAALLPAAGGAADAGVSGTVFKIERGPAGDKVAYVRLFSGTVHTRDRLRYGHDRQDTVTAVAPFRPLSAAAQSWASAGDIARLWGLRQARIGDPIGEAGPGESDQLFAPPTMESVIEARDPHDRARLRVALDQLAEQDPLIRVRQDDRLHEISVSLYGEVQQEVIQATLANEFDLEVTFRKTTTVHIERPVGAGYAVEFLTTDENPYMATVGLRLERGPIGSGVQFRLDINPRSVPLYIYKTPGRFIDRMTEYVRHALRQGLAGWEVTDCIVTMTECDYYTSDGPTKPHVPMTRTTSADFRDLTPIVLRRALERAHTEICQPVVRVELQAPASAVGALVTAAAGLGAAMQATFHRGELAILEAVMPVDQALDLQRQLPGLTGGEGSLESTFAGYEPVRGTPPVNRSAGPPGGVGRDT